MTQLPDAPWIREAERYGYPPNEPYPVECPLCGRECEEFYLDEDDSILGCPKCIKKVDAFDWVIQMHEAEEEE